jgi:restriction endonuclease S subunit
VKILTRVWSLDELILSNKVELGRGNIISKKDIASFPGNYPIYSSAREKNGTFGFYGKYMFDEELITWSIDGGGRLFYRPRHKFSVTNVGGTLRILDNDFLDCRYLHLVLTNLHSKLRFDWVYKAHPSVIRMVYNKIPIPSLKKQREIVEKLDSTFAEIDLFEENLGFRSSATENLQTSILASFFELNEEEVAEDYSFVNLGSVSLVKGGKRLPKGTKWSPEPTKYPYIRVTDMKLGRINEDNLVFVPDEIRPLIKNYTVNSGDIIISIAGTIGEIAVVPESLDKASLTENAAKIIVQKEKLDPSYCAYFLRSPVCRSQIDLLVRTTTQPKLALFRIESLRIPIPSIEKQNEIVRKLDSAFVEIELLRLQFEIEKNYAASLRQSLLSQAFTQKEEVA